MWVAQVDVSRIVNLSTFEIADAAGRLWSIMTIATARK